MYVIKKILYVYIINMKLTNTKVVRYLILALLLGLLVTMFFSVKEGFNNHTPEEKSSIAAAKAAKTTSTTTAAPTTTTTTTTTTTATPTTTTRTAKR